jgi:hypothetical protein
MYNQISPFIFDCTTCPKRCDGLSKNNYQFENDVNYSEQYEQKIIDHINSLEGYVAFKTTEPGFPDIQIINQKEQTISYLEVKAQQRTFMAVGKVLPFSGLTPSETIALNLSDLVRYIDLQDKHGLKISILWVLSNRACMVNPNETLYFFQKLDMLKNIYNAEKDKRRFKRASGEGDVVDGLHKGVTVNYHFSLRELDRWASPL